MSQIHFDGNKRKGQWNGDANYNMDFGPEYS